MTTMKQTLILLAALFTLVPAMACNGPIENTVDCHRVCKRYADCFDSNYDIAACESTCRSNANSDAGYQHNVDTCEACIDDVSCTSATFNCSSQCSTVVP